MTKYQMDLNNRRAYALLKENAIIGLLGGIILIVLGILGYLGNSGLREKLWAGLILVGVVFFLCGLICPSLMHYPSRAFRAFGNVMGHIIFSLLLSVVYVILILPVGLIMKKKANKYDLMKWETSFDGEICSTLKPKEWDAGNTHQSKESYGLLYNLFRLFTYFHMKRQHILLPVLFILILIGLIFFFVASTVIAPFIYTLF